MPAPFAGLRQRSSSRRDRRLCSGRERGRPDSHRVDHQRVAFVMADGIAMPGRRHMRRMGGVQAHHARFIIVGIEDRDPVPLLEHLHADVPEDEGHPVGPALVARGRVGHAGQRDFARPLHRLSRVPFATSVISRGSLSYRRASSPRLSTAPLRPGSPRRRSWPVSSSPPPHLVANAAAIECLLAWSRRPSQQATELHFVGFVDAAPAPVSAKASA